MGRKKRKSFMDKKKHCIFEPRKLWEIARKGIGHPRKEAFEIIINNLAEEYPGYIEKKQNNIAESQVLSLLETVEQLTNLVTLLKQSFKNNKDYIKSYYSNSSLTTSNLLRKRNFASPV